MTTTADLILDLSAYELTQDSAIAGQPYTLTDGTEGKATGLQNGQYVELEFLGGLISLIPRRRIKPMPPRQLSLF